MTGEYHIRKILEDIALVRQIPLRNFTEEYFLPEAQKNQFPILCDLSAHLAFPHGLGIEIKKDCMVAFEGSHNNLSLAYFGREVEEDSNYSNEQGLLYFEGRRIHIISDKDGDGRIEIEDIKTKEAIFRIGENAFGSSFFEFPKGKCGFKQITGNEKLPGVKAFLEFMIK